MKIIQGELPCFKLYEDDLVISFLSIQPINLGHALVVPKIEVDYFVDVPEPHYSRVFQVANPLSKAIHSATKCLRVGTAVVGLEVPHFHYHLIPLNSAGDLSFARAKTRPMEELKSIHEKIMGEVKNQGGILI